MNGNNEAVERIHALNQCHLGPCDMKYTICILYLDMPPRNKPKAYGQVLRKPVRGLSPSAIAVTEIRLSTCRPPGADLPSFPALVLVMERL